MVTINVLNYNRLHKLTYTLESLFKTAGCNNLEISVTDNGSTDGSIQFLEKMYQEQPMLKRLILLDKNYGEGRGAEIGMKYAKGHILIHSCNDLLYTRVGWVNEVVEVLDKYPEVLCYAPVITREYGPLKLLNVSFGTIKITGGVPAFCVAMRKEDYVEIGGFKDCGSVMGPKQMRRGLWSMETTFAEDVRKLADKRSVGHTGSAIPFLADSAATHDWNERGYRGQVDKFVPAISKSIIMEK